MRTYDIAPLWRSTVGFERFFDLVDAAQHGGSDDKYPLCNVERLADERYRRSLALAGFPLMKSESRLSKTRSPLKVGSSIKDNASISIGASRPVPSSGSSIWPTTSALREHSSSMVCSRLSWFETCRRP